MGKVTKVDESTVYIIPMGLESAEGVLVGNIDTLKLENGMFPVISSSVNTFMRKVNSLRTTMIGWMNMMILNMMNSSSKKKNLNTKKVENQAQSTIQSSHLLLCHSACDL